MAALHENGEKKEEETSLGLTQTVLEETPPGGVAEVSAGSQQPHGTEMDFTNSGPAALPASGDEENDAELLCSKCERPASKEEAEKSKCNTCICNKCNSKRATLSKLYGRWPIDPYNALSDSQKVHFWRTEAKYKDELHSALVSTVANSQIIEKRNTTRGKFLPLSVWKEQGLDPTDPSGKRPSPER